MSADGRALVADIGGTNARFAVARPLGASYQLEHIRRVKGEDFEDLRDAVDDYLESYPGPAPRRGCFALAGPVQGETIALTNSPWTIAPKALAAAIGFEAIIAVNDFAALGRGAPLVPESALATVGEGTPAPGAPMVVLGPGTGLGLAILVPERDGGVRVLPTEGGHAAFAPRDEAEEAVRAFIAREHDFVSFERVLSGRGLVNIHRALCAREGAHRANLRPHEITEAAISGEWPIAREAVRVFCGVLGTYVGDAVVMTGALGGVFLGGGILPKMKDMFFDSPFIARLRERPPMSRYLADVPVRLIMTDEAALLGAAALAQETRA
ncbi:MAG: glucokinase [Caulobacterales bacterium]|nr:glucokinase [Caulobacterales bacterium]